MSKSHAQEDEIFVIFNEGHENVMDASDRNSFRPIGGTQVIEEDDYYLNRINSALNGFRPFNFNREMEKVDDSFDNKTSHPLKNTVVADFTPEWNVSDAASHANVQTYLYGENNFEDKDTSTTMFGQLRSVSQVSASELDWFSSSPKKKKMRLMVNQSLAESFIVVCSPTELKDMVKTAQEVTVAQSATMRKTTVIQQAKELRMIRNLNTSISKKTVGSTDYDVDTNGVKCKQINNDVSTVVQAASIKRSTTINQTQEIGIIRKDHPRCANDPVLSTDPKVPKLNRNNMIEQVKNIVSAVQRAATPRRAAKMVSTIHELDRSPQDHYNLHMMNAYSDVKQEIQESSHDHSNVDMRNTRRTVKPAGRFSPHFDRSYY